MLTRAEIAAKLADIDLILPKTDGGNVHLEEYREALETARQLYRERDEARETIKRLNRRCTKAEAAAMAERDELRGEAQS